MLAIVDVFTHALHELHDMCGAACQASHDAAFPLDRKYHDGRVAALVCAAYLLETAIHKANAMSPANDGYPANDAYFGDEQ